MVAHLQQENARKKNNRTANPSTQRLAVYSAIHRYIYRRTALHAKMCMLQHPFGFVLLHACHSPHLPATFCFQYSIKNARLQGGHLTNMTKTSKNPKYFLLVLQPAILNVFPAELPLIQVQKGLPYGRPFQKQISRARRST